MDISVSCATCQAWGLDVCFSRYFMLHECHKEVWLKRVKDQIWFDWTLSQTYHYVWTACTVDPIFANEPEKTQRHTYPSVSIYGSIPLTSPCPCATLLNIPTSESATIHHGPLTRYAKLRVTHACHRLKRKPLVSDPGMHHDTCVTHVPWCMSGSLTCGGGENVPGIPGACATHNFASLVRGPCLPG